MIARQGFMLVEEYVFYDEAQSEDFLLIHLQGCEQRTELAAAFFYADGIELMAGRKNISGKYAETSHGHLPYKKKLR